MTDDDAVKAFIANLDLVEGDEEIEHLRGDQFLIDFLIEHGYPLLAAEYDRRSGNWWYA